MQVYNKDSILALDKLISMYRDLNNANYSAISVAMPADEYSLLQENKKLLLEEINKILKSDA